MCPLRIILLFISATLAGFLAWKTLRSSSSEVEDLISGSNSKINETPKKKEEFSFRKMVTDGLSVFVDMASGRYLWRNLRNNNNNNMDDDDDDDNGRSQTTEKKGCPFQHLLSMKKKNVDGIMDGGHQKENVCPFASRFNIFTT